MIIQIIGLPGKKTERTIVNVEEALSEFDLDVDFQWISDIYEISKLRCAHTPAVVVNDRIRAMGRIPSVYDVQTWVREEMMEELAA